VHNAHFRFDYIEGEGMILFLDMQGIAGSTGSACSTKSLEPSHVLRSLGLRHEQCHGSLRLSLSKFSTMGGGRILHRGDPSDNREAEKDVPTGGRSVIRCAHSTVRK